RTAAAEDNEVVRVVDHMRLELAPLLGQPPVLEKAVHVDVGEQWRDHSALRGAQLASLAACKPFPAILAGLLDGRLQPHLDKPQDVFVDDPPRDLTSLFAASINAKGFQQPQICPSTKPCEVLNSARNAA